MSAKTEQVLRRTVSVACWERLKREAAARYAAHHDAASRAA